MALKFCAVEAQCPNIRFWPITALTNDRYRSEADATGFSALIVIALENQGTSDESSFQKRNESFDTALQTL